MKNNIRGDSFEKVQVSGIQISQAPCIFENILNNALVAYL